MMRLAGLLGAKLQRMYFYGKSLQEQLLVKFFFITQRKQIVAAHISIVSGLYYYQQLIKRVLLTRASGAQKL